MTIDDTTIDDTIEVGPYRFSRYDAERTLARVDDLVDGFPEGAQPHLADLRRELHEVARVTDRDDIDALARAIAVVFPRLLEARDALVASGTLPATATGRVAQLNVSDGGVPKLPVDRVEVDAGGVTTDRQATRRHHGRPWQALCLWSTEVIDTLAADGHPIGPGSAGENITITGLDWPDVVHGAQLAIGSTLVQITAFAEPCRQNARWFSDGRFDRIHHRHGPISRLYATVIEPGAIGVGDRVVLEP